MTKKLSIQTAWLKNNRSPEEQEAIRYSLLTNTALINAFLDILKEFEDAEENATKSLKDYESPAYPFLRSNRDGALRAYQNIKNLFKTTET